tara:strand:+ start:1464 stop:1793 length:330 start_codon:yes stop_codon:yes gene_type:complete
MKKYNTVNVHQQIVTFYKSDDDGNTLKNDDGSTKTFVAPRYSKLRRELDDHIQKYVWDAVDSEELVEIAEMVFRGQLRHAQQVYDLDLSAEAAAAFERQNRGYNKAGVK